jgi:hypothetical protein
MPSRIEDCALVGDCETAALVSQNGFISLRQNTTGGPSETKAPVALSAIREVPRPSVPPTLLARADEVIE